MVADSRISPVAGLDSSLMQVRRRTLAQGWIQRLTSIWALGIAFVTAFVIAAGPFQQTDLLLATRWLRRVEPDLVWFAQNVLDRIAGQMICLPVLAAVALVIARYTGASQRAVRWLTAAVALIAVNSVVVSFLLGWHWVSDLVGGVLAGGSSCV